MAVFDIKAYDMTSPDVVDDEREHVYVDDEVMEVSDDWSGVPRPRLNCHAGSPGDWHLLVLDKIEHFKLHQPKGPW